MYITGCICLIRLMLISISHSKIARKLHDGDYIGTSMTGLAHTYLKQGNYPLALSHYQTAIDYLKAAGDDDIFVRQLWVSLHCIKKQDKMIRLFIMLNASLATAKKDGFLGHQLEATWSC